MCFLIAVDQCSIAALREIATLPTLSRGYSGSLPGCNSSGSSTKGNTPLTTSSEWLPSTPFFSGKATGSVTQHAKLYDVLFSDYALDIPMYLKGTSPHLGVLECGMGTGRITMPLAQSGRPVVGVDNSDAMLEELKSKLGDDPSVRTKIKIVKADLRSFNLDESFKSVIPVHDL